jgi:hypothetical protein
MPGWAAQDRRCGFPRVTTSVDKGEQ